MPPSILIGAIVIWGAVTIYFAVRSRDFRRFVMEARSPISKALASFIKSLPELAGQLVGCHPLSQHCVHRTL